jgi:leucyl aminopeptidase
VHTRNLNIPVELVGEEALPQLEADLVAIPYSGSPTGLIDRVNRSAGGRLGRLLSAGEARPDAGSTALAHVDGLRAERIALVGVGGAGELDADGLRTGAASAARAAAALGGRLAWVIDHEIERSGDEQVRAVVEGVLLGGYDPGRWKTSGRAAQLRRLFLAGAPETGQRVAARAEVVARWTNHARELVDGPPNEVTPAGLADSARALLKPTDVSVDVLGAMELERLGLRALTAVGAGSVNSPCLIILRRAGSGDVLGLIGKAITFDSGGLFLKRQDDIVRQKADMGGGAAVIAAFGAIAELGLPLALIGVVPAAENMIGGGAYRPGDIVTTAAGLTVEVTNPDAEGRLVMADALWYAQQNGATRLIDIATLTGAMRAGMGDLYAGVFANDARLQDALVAAGAASGDHVWPWPLHRRYRKLLDSQLADLRNTAGRSFGYPIIAATFLGRFVGELPWAHIDNYSNAYLDEERDYFRRGATGAGVRLLVELADQLGAASGC